MDVARAIGVSGAAISDWEADKKVPREPLLAALAAYLGTTPGYLRYGIPDAKTPTPIEVGGQVFNPDPTLDYKVTDEEHAADEAEYQAQQAAKARPRPKQA